MERDQHGVPDDPDTFVFYMFLEMWQFVQLSEHRFRAMADQRLHLESYRPIQAVIRNLSGLPFLRIMLKSGNHRPRNTTDRN